MSFILLLYLTSMTLSLVFTTITHPLAMGMMLLLQTLTICAITSLLNFHVWFSYILFLIFLGGMLVLFIYITSLASNEMFQFSFKMISFFIIMMSLGFFLSMILDPLLLDFKMSSSDMHKYMGETYNMQAVLIGNIYSSNTMNTTLFMILYLLLTLIVVVKITYTFLGPLRMLTT
uniref:NADH-ubiquinone oxidoreductase chain 6 n=2 Tax=Gonodactylidae TaxID=75391 RepID=A0A8K1YX24_9CRUS|nr:NADH dehydrogenase subunit 6 [Gonodactylus smithii]QTK16229.1 NADH dehydrogenase subunit 6 [Gonodactylus smithii]UEV86999.1 NADH dehydrogenase subunit 6 [Gonodactylellus affinis]